MIEDIIERLAVQPDVIRVTVSDREGLLISAAQGPAETSGSADSDVSDDLWNAYMAQFASNLKSHLKNITLARPLELVVNGTDDAVVIVWLHVGWLIARVRSSTDWPRLWTAVRGIRNEFDTLTGIPVQAGS